MSLSCMDRRDKFLEPGQDNMRDNVLQRFTLCHDLNTNCDNAEFSQIFGRKDLLLVFHHDGCSRR